MINRNGNRAAPVLTHATGEEASLYCRHVRRSTDLTLVRIESRGAAMIAVEGVSLAAECGGVLAKAREGKGGGHAQFLAGGRWRSHVSGVHAMHRAHQLGAVGPPTAAR